MKKNCKHKQRHTEKIQGSSAMFGGYFLGGKYHPTEIPAKDSVIKTWCADCGKKLKETSLNDYKKNN